jgi:dienelactone hydrolase
MPDEPRKRTPLRRDDQQWIFDYLVKETGAVYHWWSDGGRDVPKSVRTHAMISKHMAKQAQGIEALAKVETAAGHDKTALGLWFNAAKSYMRAQHPVLQLNDEKRFLYAAMRRCYDEMRKLAPYPIERVEVAWNGATVGGWLHLMPEKAKAPLLFYVPGSDVTAETFPEPPHNPAFERGMHVFSFDGPGQGSANMAGIRLTPDAYESAAKPMLDALAKRAEIDAERIVTYGTGMGGFWAMRVAAHDRRIKAAATKSSYAEKSHVTTEDSPRYKQLFAFLTQAASEEELDRTMADMTLDGHMEQVRSPALLVVGEYDHRDPIDEVYRLFDRLATPGELWVFADQLHRIKIPGGESVLTELMFDWLADRLAGRPQPNRGQVVWVEPGTSPNDPKAARKRRWFDAAR